jgi:hypothetical protein
LVNLCQTCQNITIKSFNKSKVLFYIARTLNKAKFTMLLKTKTHFAKSSYKQASFYKGHTFLFICDLTSLSVLNGIGHVVSFSLKKVDRFCKALKSEAFLQLQENFF